MQTSVTVASNFHQSRHRPKPSEEPLDTILVALADYAATDVMPPIPSKNHAAE
ncbi:hypothetical protein SAMN06265222_102139 [Neorhodopirellula lusitana]|uniref:Transcriptional regulator n=1 Tax=Neorhodopirellula lusitana TaxID=445327 RepID=A0ABY1PTH2_9BACT|nr:hypothetical protein [Neorhodopirellula lusitana]SMP46509.1 hypothetical protein SAMN06265222_102139 [Neorhodopirellula lusitana]